MPRVSMFVISSAKIQTSPSTSLGLKRYMFPFSAVNSAIAQPAFVTLTPSALIALLVSLATRVISGLSEYAPMLSCMRATSLCAETKPDISKVFLTPVLPVTSKTFPSVSVASTFSAPSVAVSAALMAVSKSLLRLISASARVFSAFTLSPSAVALSASACLRVASASARLFSALTLVASASSNSVR